MLSIPLMLLHQKGYKELALRIRTDIQEYLLFCAPSIHFTKAEYKGPKCLLVFLNSALKLLKYHYETTENW